MKKEKVGDEEERLEMKKGKVGDEERKGWR